MPQHLIDEGTDLFAFLDQATAKAGELIDTARGDGRIDDFRMKFVKDYSKRVLEQFGGISLSGEEKAKLSERSMASLEKGLGAIQSRGLKEGEVRPAATRRTQERLTDRVAGLQQFARQTRGKLALDAASTLLRGGRIEKKQAFQEQKLMLDTMARWDELQLKEELGLDRIDIERAFNDGQIENRKMAIGLERVAILLGFQIQREEIEAQLAKLEAENKSRWNQVIQTGAAIFLKFAISAA